MAQTQFQLRIAMTREREMSARAFATQKLIEIYKTAPAGSAKQIATISALGRIGGIEAAKILEQIYNTAPPGSKKQLAAIEALGEVGRST
jgi:hypothetical protein